MPTLATLIQQSIGSPSHRNKKERKGGKEGDRKEGIKKGKGIQIRQEDLKLLLFADDMLLYIENPGDATKNIIQLIREFGDVAGCKINIQKSVLCLVRETGPLGVIQSKSFIIKIKPHPVWGSWWRTLQKVVSFQSGSGPKVTVGQQGQEKGRKTDTYQRTFKKNCNPEGKQELPMSFRKLLLCESR